MGLFNKMLSIKDMTVCFSAEEAFFAITVAVAVADGDITEQKLDDVASVVQRMKLFRQQSGPDHDAMVEKIFGFLKKNGSLALARKGAEFLPVELRETAFAVSVDLALTNCDVEEREQDLIDQLQVGLKIADRSAMKIIEVMEIKNCA